MKKEIDNYLRQFEAAQKGRGGSEPSWLNRSRTDAIECFAKAGFPVVGEEGWKYTNVAPLTAVPFTINGTATAGGAGPAGDTDPARFSPQDISTLVPGAYANHLLVFINGHYASRLSRPGPLPEGVRLGSLSDILADSPDLLEPHLGRLSNRLSGAKKNTDPFSALNTAFMEDGAVVLLPMGTVVKTPIYLVFLSTDTEKPRVTCPRNLIVAGENSQAAIVEYYLGPKPVIYFTNSVTEVIVGDNSVIEHTKIQEEADPAFHIATLEVIQRQSSCFVSNYLSLGGFLSRNNIHARLDAEGCDCTLNGLYLGGDRQHMDSHTLIDHLKPHGTSNELYKGVLGGKSRGVFDGKIIVHRDAQKTSARQTNKNLLLSGESEANPTPQLEIFADDVKVSHGSTVGQLDKNQVFYLRSRGIGESAAKSLLTYAFAGELVDKIKIPAIKDRVKEALTAKIGPMGPV
ncbi:MAG: Fe-S cluster assembly protein SufD [Deltaproteobacteria bacterium]|nr:Fe-S cluster assembly protein SufD [Deltaproteobacteria bacterium]